MIQKLIQNWWLLVLCGVLEAVISALYLIMQGAHGPLTFHAWRGTVEFLGSLAMAAGACTIAAGALGSAKRTSWLLVLNGLACSALGLIYVAFVRYPISFRTIALLIVVMALSIGIYELATAQTLRRHLADEWLLGAAGVASVGFAFAFFAFVLRWIQLDPRSPGQTLLWLGSFFGFSAICMLGMALRLNRLQAAIHRMAGNALPSA